ncbi:MAG TPA: Bax inhibitor-1/YccA family protein [Bacteroidia bacterium]|nr:Bax inhibitor-1/YccA family protein [Bacteroidia bacterium]
MENQNFNFKDPIDVQNVSSEVMSKTFVSKVFSWMFIGLGITGFVSYLFASTPSLIGSLMTQTTTGASMSALGWIVMFAPLGLVLLMGAGINKLSYPAMIGVFFVFATLMGMSLSFIFLAYTSSSIFTVFLIAAAMFGVMAVVGYTTDTDLTKFGSLMLMLLVGVIIASLVNVFMHSDSFSYMISFICVAIFTGLTAYDVQKIKRIGAQINADGSTTGKMAISGALSLYLDFINLFLALLRIFGSRR